MEYKPNFLSTALLKDRLKEMASCGLKSIMYAGEGEPLLHKDIIEIINHTKKEGIDVAVTTNGVLLNDYFVENSLASISWIKISINGATKETYSKIHRTNPNDFDIVMKNISYAVNVRQRNGYKCTLGMQLLLLPENLHEVEILAQKAKEMGLDYLVIKPYSQHLFSKTILYREIRYNKFLNLADKLEKYNDKHFSVIFRVNTMKKWDEKKRNYEKCLALPFWSYIDASGNIWGCSAYLGDERFLYGNIYKNTFKEIWKGKRRKQSLEKVESINTTECRVNCRMDNINKYLWELTHSSEHVNFI